MTPLELTKIWVDEAAEGPLTIIIQACAIHRPEAILIRYVCRYPRVTVTVRVQGRREWHGRGASSTVLLSRSGPRSTVCTLRVCIMGMLGASKQDSPTLDIPTGESSRRMIEV